MANHEATNAANATRRSVDFHSEGLEGRKCNSPPRQNRHPQVRIGRLLGGCRPASRELWELQRQEEPGNRKAETRNVQLCVQYVYRQKGKRFSESGGASQTVSRDSVQRRVSGRGRCRGCAC